MLSNKVKCLCSHKIKDPLVATGCSDDMIAVSALPDNWTPRKCKATLADYLKKREKDYNDVLNTMLIEAQVMNNSIDEKVREVADILISNIHQNQNEIQCLTKKPETGYSLSIEERDNALKKVAKLAMERIEDLNKFKQDCFALERQRADELGEILKYKFQALINVGHKSPKDLLHDFDERIFDINQQLISNSRAYIELEAQLRRQLDENLVSARSTLNELCLRNTVNKFEDSPSQLRKNRFSFETLNSDNNEENQLSKNILSLNINDLSKLKEMIPMFLEKYYKTRSELFNQFLEQLSNLASLESSSYIQSSNPNKTSDITCIDVKCYDLDIEESIAKIIYSDVLNVQNNLNLLNNQIYDMHLILQNTCQLYNNMINRFSLGQKLIAASLDDMQTSHDSIEMSNEVNFNTAIEQLLNASDNDKLQQQKDFIINYLNKIPETYNQHKNIESVKVEDFINIASIISNVVLSEIDCFRSNHHRTQLNTAENQNSPLQFRQTKELLDLRIPLLETALETELQRQEIIEYKNNYLVTLETNFDHIIERLNRKTREWIEKMNELINMRYSLKLMCHSIRAERVKAAFNTRFSELRFHESQLNSHIDAMYNIIDNMPLEASEYLAIDAPQLYPFCNWINSIKEHIDNLIGEETIDSEVKRLKMISYSYRIVKHRQMFEESLSSAIDKRKREVETDIQRARISNVNFSSQIRLFSEGGKYSSSEATRTCTALVKAGDALEAACNRTLDVLTHRRLQLLGLADQQVAPLQRIVEDNLKHGAKNVFDKKVLPSNKKK